jgi:hypothetical protein
VVSIPSVSTVDSPFGIKLMSKSGVTHPQKLLWKNSDHIWRFDKGTRFNA